MVPIEYFIGLFFLLGALSFLYKETHWFRFVEFTLMGTAVANALVFSANVIRVQGVQALVAGNWIMIIPLALGVMVLTRLIRGVEYLSNWPIALVVGVGTALSIRGHVSADIITQIRVSLTWAFGRTTPMSLANGLLTALFAVFTLMVFTFSREHKGILGWVGKIGRMVLMVAFGVNAASNANFYLNQIVTKVEQILVTIGLLPL